MTESQSPAQVAKHTAINFGWYTVICLAIVFVYVALDTNFFTKPPSWFHLRESHVLYFPPAAPDVPADIHTPTKGKLQ